MAEQQPQWAFPENVQPKSEELRFDLDTVLRSVVLLRAEVPEDAFTAPVLGTERTGNGVIIAGPDRDLVLTIGFLITEAESIWLTTNDGHVVPGHPLAYDQPTGFGLVLPLAPLKAPAITRGTAKSLRRGSRATVVGHGGRAHSLKVSVIAKREFAGYWEYLLEEAIFTAPAHPHWGGTALVGSDGKLLGVGSLLVQQQTSGEDETVNANMFVPIDLLEPILDDLVLMGQARRVPRPWLGMYASEQESSLIVAGLSQLGPAQQAGVQPGDIVLEVAGRPVTSLPQLFRAVWSLGSAGTRVPLTIERDSELLRIQVESANREDFLKKPMRH
jgi:S1-C subfamily serine protease